MEKQLKDYLHLFLGCQIQYPDNARDRTITAKFTGFSREDGVETTYNGQTQENKAIGDYLAWKENGYHNANAFHIKPILRPLSSMTRGESLVIFKADRVHLYNDPQRKAADLFLFTPHEFKILLEMGFDVFDLIADGLAIDETKIPRP